MKKVLLSVVAVGTIGFSMLHASEEDVVFCNQLNAVAPKMVSVLVDSYSLLHDVNSTSCEQINHNEFEAMASRNTLFLQRMISAKNAHDAATYRSIVDKAKQIKAKTPEAIDEVIASINLSSTGQN